MPRDGTDLASSKVMSPTTSVVPTPSLEECIHLIRGKRVILDFDLAALYRVPTKVLVQAVKRNSERFPGDFMFRLEFQEVTNLRSQSVTSSYTLLGRHGGRRSLPFAFTEHGAIMAATMLNSPRAIDASVYVVRAFVRLRALVAGHHQLAEKLVELERRVEGHDDSIRSLVTTIRRMMEPACPEKRRIGFQLNGNSADSVKKP